MTDAFVFYGIKWERLCMKNPWRRTQFPFQHHLLINEISTGTRQRFIIHIAYIHVTRTKQPTITDNCFLLKAKNYQQQQVNTLSVVFLLFPYCYHLTNIKTIFLSFTRYLWAILTTKVYKQNKKAIVTAHILYKKDSKSSFIIFKMYNRSNHLIRPHNWKIR